MTKNNSKAFNTFTQKLKKHNKESQTDIDRYKKAPNVCRGVIAAPHR